MSGIDTSRIRIISASAGAGKTTRLANELCDALVSGSARPEAVLATTFTRKAAAELQERARAALIESGRVDDAHQLGGARIGTVNSVCGALVQDYALELGLSPDLRVVDENVAERLLREAISEGLGPEERTLQDLASRLEPLQVADDSETKKSGRGKPWQEAVQQIVTLAQSNGLDTAALQHSEERSVASLMSLLPEAGSEDAVEAMLREALENFARVFPTLPKTTKEGQGSYEKVQTALNALGGKKSLSWSQWLNLQKLKVGSPNTNPEAAQLANAVVEAARRDLEHPRFRHDLEEWIRLAFRLARSALSSYEERKKALGVIDFTDQERYALKLLGLPPVQEQLRDELDLVLVDEFQDTSPLQLAIFLKLACLAKRTVWVGDQKQAIFAFRGTDPALMGAALDAIASPHADDSNPSSAAGTEPLTKSWRSRPELVRLTSDVFVKAFAPSLPESLVRIEPGKPDEPPGLGSIVELWQLDGKRKNEEFFASLASCVKRLLEDNTVLVRDRSSNRPRAVEPGDIAVLLRSNDYCAAVAGALEARGIRSVLPRAGLLETLEGRILVAALRVWISSRDRLARAELSRMLDGAEGEDGWFADLIRRTSVPPPDGSQSKEVPSPEAPDGLAHRLITNLLERRHQHPTAGAVEAVGHCLESMNLRELCLGWGGRQRLSNLDALRALTVAWVDACAQAGQPATVEGLVVHFDAIAGTGDAQSADVDDAVTVSTWHSAKGLEWPITVLYVGGEPHGDQAWGVGIESAAEFDLAKPLAGRWIRFWPWPYASNANAPLDDRAKNAPDVQNAFKRQAYERLRLLYVGWTRARDRLVLAAPNDKFLEGSLSVLRSADGTAVLEPPAPVMTWAGRPVEANLRDSNTIIVEGPPQDPVAGTGTNPVGERQHPPAKVLPSAIEEQGQSTKLHSFDQRPKLRYDLDRMDAFGTAVHNFLAADLPGLTDAERLALAKRQLEAQGVTGAPSPKDPLEFSGEPQRGGEVTGAPSPKDLLEFSDHLRAFVARSWPGATWHREWPVAVRRPDGTLIAGTADLVLETADGFVVIDHKTFAGDESKAEERAAGYAGQLRAYADAIRTATGRPVLATAIHFPVLGLVYEVGSVAQEAAA